MIEQSEIIILTQYFNSFKKESQKIYPSKIFIGQQYFFILNWINISYFCDN